MSTTLDTKTEVVRLRAMDYSFSRIAAAMNLSKPTVIDICSELEAEIARARQGELDTVQKDISYATDERSTLYRQLIGKIHAEIITRDITQVATERLFNMLERTERSLSAIEQRTITKDDDPFAGLTDKQLEAIANSTVKVRIIDERPTSDKLTEPKVD